MSNFLHSKNPDIDSDDILNQIRNAFPYNCLLTARSDALLVSHEVTNRQKRRFRHGNTSNAHTYTHTQTHTHTNANSTALSMATKTPSQQHEKGNQTHSTAPQSPYVGNITRNNTTDVITIQTQTEDNISGIKELQIEKPKPKEIHMPMSIASCFLKLRLSMNQKIIPALRRSGLQKEMFLQNTIELNWPLANKNIWLTDEEVSFLQMLTEAEISTLLEFPHFLFVQKWMKLDKIVKKLQMVTFYNEYLLASRYFRQVKNVKRVFDGFHMNPNAKKSKKLSIFFFGCVCFVCVFVPTFQNKKLLLF